LIYRLSTPATTKTSYLMGTMHVADARAFAHVPLAAQYIKECAHYIGEMDLSSVDATLIRAAFSLPPEFNYSTFFKPKKYEKIQHIIAKCFDLNLALYDDIAPIFIQSMITNKILNQDHDLSLDQHLLKMALDANLTVSGLETQAEQYDIAKKLDVKVQMKQFVDLCRNPSAYRKQVNHLCELYHQGDVDQLYKSSKKSLGSFRHIMLYDRNKVMGQRAYEAIMSSSCFISVGAGHLAGMNGILAHLKRSNVKCTKLV
jgi:uncharacterized protein